MTPEIVDQWIKIFRDLVVISIGAFICVFEVTEVNPPNAVAIGAGVTLLGVPAAIRLDQANRKRKEGGKNGEGENDERWTHLP